MVQITDREWQILFGRLDRIEGKLDEHITDAGAVRQEISTLQAEMRLVKAVGAAASAVAIAAAIGHFINI